MNKGLSNELKKAFPDIIPVPKPALVMNQEIKDPNWLAGFTEGEGCFHIEICQLKTLNTGSQVRLMFTLAQHARDAELMKTLAKYFDCGNYHERSTQSASVFNVSRFSDIVEKIITFFEKYQLHGLKSLDFKDFCKVAELMKIKGHLTPEGLEEICKIKAGMNRGRS
jgi:hypothetical protein